VKQRRYAIGNTFAKYRIFHNIPKQQKPHKDITYAALSLFLIALDFIYEEQ
jgi:hypothetical protein